MLPAQDQVYMALLDQRTHSVSHQTDKCHKWFSHAVTPREGGGPGGNQTPENQTDQLAAKPQHSEFPKASKRNTDPPVKNS